MERREDCGLRLFQYFLTWISVDISNSEVWMADLAISAISKKSFELQFSAIMFFESNHNQFFICHQSKKLKSLAIMFVSLSWEEVYKYYSLN